MTDWATTFKEWASPPNDTEKRRCENAILVIKNAIQADSNLRDKVDVFVQGSYRNNVNVKQSSDVDIAVLYTGGTFFTSYPLGMKDSDFGYVTSQYTFQNFKNNIESALVSYLGSKAITRSNKAFDVHETTYHVDADVVPVFEFKRYNDNGKYISGVKLISDDLKVVINYPQQHYDNGVAKNKNTQRRYKQIVRIIKKTCFEMQNLQMRESVDLAGFMLECLIYNVPDLVFSVSDDLMEITKACVRNIYARETEYKNFVEVNELKYLFHISQEWKESQVKPFLEGAWYYWGF